MSQRVVKLFQAFVSDWEKAKVPDREIIRLLLLRVLSLEEEVKRLSDEINGYDP